MVPGAFTLGGSDRAVVIETRNRGGAPLADQEGISSAGPRGPGRPRLRPIEVDRRAVLDAACAVFAARGFEGASVELIAQRADVARPAIYELFGSKQGLVLAAVADASERLIAEVDEVISDPVRPSHDVVRDALQALFGLVEAHPEALTVLLLAESSPAVSDESGLGDGRRRLVASITARMRSRWADQGVEAGPVAELVSAMVFAMTEAAARRWMDGGLEDLPVVDLLATFVHGGVHALTDAGFGLPAGRGPA